MNTRPANVKPDTCGCPTINACSAVPPGRRRQLRCISPGAYAEASSGPHEPEPATTGQSSRCGLPHKSHKPAHCAVLCAQLAHHPKRVCVCARAWGKRSRSRAPYRGVCLCVSPVVEFRTATRAACEVSHLQCRNCRNRSEGVRRIADYHIVRSRIDYGGRGIEAPLPVPSNHGVRHNRGGDSTTRLRDGNSSLVVVKTGSSHKCLGKSPSSANNFHAVAHVLRYSAGVYGYGDWWAWR